MVAEVKSMGIRVLVVEDEPIIALDIRQQLDDAGSEVLGPVTSVANALQLIAEPGCDVAVLNVNLGSETSEPIAQKLQASGKPFVVLSGYPTDNLAPSLKGATFLRLPRSGLALEYQSDQADGHSRDGAARHGLPDGAPRVPASHEEWGNAKAFHDLNSYRHGIGNCRRLCLPRGVPRREDCGRHRGLHLARHRPVPATDQDDHRATCPFDADRRYHPYGLGVVARPHRAQDHGMVHHRIAGLTSAWHADGQCSPARRGPWPSYPGFRVLSEPQNLRPDP